MKALFFTVHKSKTLKGLVSIDPTDEYGVVQPQQERPLYHRVFYSPEIIVVRTQDDDEVRVYHVQEITGESELGISGYCIEGESQL